MFDDENGDERDAQGRLHKGHCPNPRGRPRKYLKIPDADVHRFKSAMVTFNCNGEQRTCSREELLLESIFEKAIKGKGHYARLVLDLFKESDKDRAELVSVLREMFAQKNKPGVDKGKLLQSVRLAYALLNDGRDLPFPKEDLD